MFSTFGFALAVEDSDDEELPAASMAVSEGSQAMASHLPHWHPHRAPQVKPRVEDLLDRGVPVTDCGNGLVELHLLHREVHQTPWLCGLLKLILWACVITSLPFMVHICPLRAQENSHVDLPASSFGTSCASQSITHM